MKLSEVTAFLNWRREEVKIAIRDGVTLPKSQEKIKLKATSVGTDFDIAENDLDDFITAFEREEPSRHPPTWVRRQLMVEANHRCAICKNAAPLQYHHILEFAKIKHHDPDNMLAICGTCHSKIHLGHIDVKSQKMYKERCRRASLAAKLNVPYEDIFPNETEPVRLSWYDIRDVVEALHANLSSIDVHSESKYDFLSIDLKDKNILNKLGKDYFEMMKDYHEPHFGNIKEFLSNPLNSEVALKYHEIVDEIRSIIAAERSNFVGFEELLIWIRQSATKRHELKDKGKSLNILLSYMYFHCDIGRKA